MKKTILILISVGLVLAVLSVLGTYAVSKYNLDEIYAVNSNFRIIGILTGISYVLTCIIVIILAIVIMYQFAAKENYTDENAKTLSVIMVSVIAGIVVIIFLFLALYHAEYYISNRYEKKLKWEAVSNFYVNARELNSEDDATDFADTVPFSWDTLYIFSHEFNQNEIDKYADEKNINELQRAFDKVNQINEPEGESILCFFNDGILIITMDIGMSVYENEQSDNVIYFEEFNYDSAHFYCSEFDAFEGSKWILVD